MKYGDMAKTPLILGIRDDFLAVGAILHPGPSKPQRRVILPCMSLGMLQRTKASLHSIASLGRAVYGFAPSIKPCMGPHGSISIHCPCVWVMKSSLNSSARLPILMYGCLRMPCDWVVARASLSASRNARVDPDGKKPLCWPHSTTVRPPQCTTPITMDLTAQTRQHEADGLRGNTRKAKMRCICLGTATPLPLGVRAEPSRAIYEGSQGPAVAGSGRPRMGRAR